MDTTAAASGAAPATRFQTPIAEHPDNASVCQIALTMNVATTDVVARAGRVSAAKPVSTSNANLSPVWEKTYAIRMVAAGFVESVTNSRIRSVRGPVCATARQVV